MTPFLANQSLGVDSYKWILFGEDDTVFFVENALKLLGHLDPDLPYFLTDNIHYPQKHIDGRCVFFWYCDGTMLDMSAQLPILPILWSYILGQHINHWKAAFALVVVAPHWYCACF